MKLVLTVLLCATIIGMSNSAMVNVNPKCNICKIAMDWMRLNENISSEMKNDEDVSQEFIKLLDSDLSAESACGLLAMCELDDKATAYLTNLKGGRGGGGRGGGGRGGGGRGGRGRTHIHVNGHDVICPVINTC